MRRGIAEIKISARKGNLKRLIDFIVGFARGQGLEHQRVWELELVADEVFMNIIDYAYPKQEGDISVTCRSDLLGLRVDIRDRGVPFNPLDFPERDPERVSRNGFGLVLVRGLLDDITYRRQEGENRLTLVKKSQGRAPVPEPGAGP